MKKIVCLFVCLTVCLFSGIANAALVDLTWSTTVQSTVGPWPSFAGEAITTTLTVDNGGATTASQTWTGADFVSFRIDGASGWWYYSTSIDTTPGNYVTDAIGNVTGVGAWQTSAISPATSSWTGLSTGQWFLNGGNDIASLQAPAFQMLNATNVADNQNPAAWTATLAGGASVPEPGTMVLALIAFGGATAGTYRRRRKLHNAEKL